MTVEELINKLRAYPAEMLVKVSTVSVEDIAGRTQGGEDFVKIVLGKAKAKWEHF